MNLETGALTEDIQKSSERASGGITPSSPEVVFDIKDKEQVPLLFLDVSLAQGNMQTLVVYENDDVGVVVETFCKAHELGTEKRTKLFKVVENHLKSLLHVCQFHLLSSLSKTDRGIPPYRQMQ